MRFAKRINYAKISRDKRATYAERAPLQCICIININRSEFDEFSAGLFIARTRLLIICLANWSLISLSLSLSRWNTRRSVNWSSNAWLCPPASYLPAWAYPRSLIENHQHLRNGDVLGLEIATPEGMTGSVRMLFLTNSTLGAFQFE